MFFHFLQVEASTQGLQPGISLSGSVVQAVIHVKEAASKRKLEEKVALEKHKAEAEAKTGRQGRAGHDAVRGRHGDPARNKRLLCAQTTSETHCCDDEDTGMAARHLVLA